MNTNVEQHYSRLYIFESIIVALEHAGISKEKITRKDLSMVDEFHVRGLEVTKELAASAGLQKDMNVLDVGCGIGGPARLLAEEYGCFVTGIDLTIEYIRTASLLSGLTGLADHTYFLQADALHLPFDNACFDTVWTQHVQMNIGDKFQFYSEISRVLKPGGSFIYYDIFSVDNSVIRFPVPWAETAELNHLVTIEELHKLLGSCGLMITGTTNQTDRGIIFIKTLLEKIATQGPPLVSLQLLIGDSFAEKLGNLFTNLVEKKVRLESGVCRKI